MTHKKIVIIGSGNRSFLLCSEAWDPPIREFESSRVLGGVYAPSINSGQSKLPIALENATQNQTQINTVALHLDNDYAGRNASENIALQLRGNYEVRNEPPPYGKDCNDYFQQMIRQKHSRQMGR